MTGSGFPLAFYFISSRLFDSDFRSHLVQALVSKGYEVCHVRVGRRVVVTGPHEKRAEMHGILGLLKFIKDVRACIRKSAAYPIFVDTTGAFIPLRSVLFRVCFRGLWCFDIFDDLLYELRGFSRLKRRFEIALLAWSSPIKLVMSREMLPLFPTAFHLDNAGHTRRIVRVRNDCNDIVTLSSIDSRFDFGLLKELAASHPHLKISCVW